MSEKGTRAKGPACRSLGAVDSLLRRSDWRIEIRRFVLLRFALDSGVDANDPVAALVQKLIEAQHKLPRRARFPSTHRVLGLNQVGQVILALAQRLVQQ